MEQEDSKVVKMLSPKDLIDRYITVAKITVYLVNAEGLWEAMYYCLVSLEDAQSSFETILSRLTQQAKDNNKVLNVNAMNDQFFKLNIEGETDYTIQIFVGTAIVTRQEFEGNPHTVEKMLDSMIA